MKYIFMTMTEGSEGGKSTERSRVENEKHKNKTYTEASRVPV